MKNEGFVERLIDLFGSSKASMIQRSLGISHQAAVNYLSGRLPSAEILIKIAEKTSCSIDWLLTGHGKKFREAFPVEGTHRSTGQRKTMVGRFLVEVTIDEKGNQPVHLTTVKLQSGDVMSEKVYEPSNALNEKKP